MTIEEKQDKLLAQCQEHIDLVKNVLPERIGELNDGFHSFLNLYDHRVQLYLALCRTTKYQVFKTKKNFEKEEWKGWFLLCLSSPLGQISYHIPDKYWDDISCDEEEYNYKYDGHSSEDVLERLKSI